MRDNMAPALASDDAMATKLAICAFRGRQRDERDERDIRKDSDKLCA